MISQMKEFIQTVLAFIKIYRLKRRGAFRSDGRSQVYEDRNFKRYFAQMQEIAKRFRAIRKILASKRALLTEEDFDNEFLWLQLRMIIELATFGAVAADEQRYAVYRQTINKKHYTTDGKVNKILPLLKDVNPDYFLPIPLIASVRLDDSGVAHVQGDASFVDADRLIEIHNRAGEHLHSRNPLSATQRAKTHDMVRMSRETFLADYDYVWKILKFHMKACLIFDENTGLPTHRSKPDLVWMVHFDESKKGAGVMMHRGNFSIISASDRDEPGAANEPQTSSLGIEKR
jgi:hypothetical protein